MSAKDFAGTAGLIFVLTSAVSILAELFDSGGPALRAALFAAYGLSAALLVAAAVLGSRSRRVGEAPVVPVDGPTQPFPGQRGAKNPARSR